MNKKDVCFFDAMAPTWDQIITIDSDKINHILDIAKISDCRDILDVGTGTGVLIPFLINRAGDAHIDAVDISEGMLKEAKRKFGDLASVDFKLMDVETEQAEKTYDCIIMYCMYPHLTQPEDTVEWLSKVNLNPGGSLVVAFPEGKDAINTIHHHNDGTVHSVKLADADFMKSIFEARGLNVDYTEDNDDYYILRITKTA